MITKFYHLHHDRLPFFSTSTSSPYCQWLWCVSWFNDRWWRTNTISSSIYMLRVGRDTQSSPLKNSLSISLTKPSCLSFVNHLKAWQMCIGSFRASPLKAFASLSFTPTSLIHNHIVQSRHIAWLYTHCHCGLIGIRKCRKMQKTIYCNEKVICRMRESYLCLRLLLTYAEMTEAG